MASMRRVGALAVLAHAALAAAMADGAAAKPHVLLVLVDDFGWNDIGYHRARLPDQDQQEIRTPNLDNLVRAGVELNRFYTYNYCSPSRAALQSGRLPVHVSANDVDPLSVNPADPVSGFSGIPRNMTGIAAKMRQAGYRTHMTGKWDAGMATYEHTPLGRGYESFFGYFHHANDYWDQTLSSGSTVHMDLCAKRGHDLVDLWRDDKPASGENGTAYEEFMFTDNSLRVIEEHNASNSDEPLFLFHAFHTVHTPLQIPKERERTFRFLFNQDRRRYAAMVEYMDESIGLMVASLQRKGMWDNTLFILTSDNGGPLYGLPVSLTGPDRVYGGASNFPLRGGKMSDWEGGIRVNALASGGAIPVPMRGTVLDDYIHIADWYATLCEAAGVSAHDVSGENANLPPVDSMSMWPLLMGQAPAGSGPRTEIHVSRKTLIQGRWKLLTGSDNAIIDLFDENHMTFDTYNPGYGWKAIKNVFTRGRFCGNGCLFDIRADPHETEDLAATHPEIVTTMMTRLQELNKDNFEPDRGTPTELGCQVAVEQYGGFYGPFVGLDGASMPQEADLASTRFDSEELALSTHQLLARS